MSQETPARVPAPRTFTASQDVCPEDGSKLWIVQHRKRIIHGIDESIAATFRDARCMREDCPLHDRRYRPAEESMLVLPKMSFGLDVVMAVGSMRMREDTSFPKIHARLVERGVPIAPMTVQYAFRYYLALTSCVAGRVDQKLLRKLRRQGGIIPVVDGVQFGEGDPVLYLIVDALSRRPLFGQEFMARAGRLPPALRRERHRGHEAVREGFVPLLRRPAHPADLQPDRGDQRRRQTQPASLRRARLHGQRARHVLRPHLHDGRGAQLVLVLGRDRGGHRLCTTGRLPRGAGPPR